MQPSTTGRNRMPEMLGVAAVELAQDRAKATPTTTRGGDIPTPAAGAGVFASLIAKVGRRYKSASFSAYVADRPGQLAAVTSLRKYATDWEQNRESGRGVILYGPRGTGKDHLAVATVGKILMDHSPSCEWVDGQELYGLMRDKIGSDASEGDQIRRFTSPDLLIISDPLPQADDKTITDYQQSVLWRIVDRRYRDMKPVWMTVNVADSKELDRRMGRQLADRLMDGALVIHCEWVSYRKPETVVK